MNQAFSTVGISESIFPPIWDDGFLSGNPLSFIDRTKSMVGAKLADIVKGVGRPDRLYHGSAYKQDELKPGYQHTKKVTIWDKYESNVYLYASDDREAAMLLGISSAIEKRYELSRTKIDHSTKTLKLEFASVPASRDDIFNLEVYLYTIKYEPGIWIKNNNPFNNIDGEYKTKETITDIIYRQRLDVREVLNGWSISIS